MATANPMTDVYKKLAAFGLPKAYVRGTLLPDWWDDEAALTQQGLSEALLYISRHAGLDIKALRGGIVEAHPRMLEGVRYKKDRDVAEDELVLATSLASQCARVAALGAPVELASALKAEELREKLLESANWVGFELLLDHCWSVGIPVLHVSEFPKGAKRMSALTTNVDGRPVIVLSKNYKHPSEMLFVLAHELGHIALGHIRPGEVLVNPGEPLLESKDAWEIEANRFAIELLTGKPDLSVVAPSRWPKADQLALLALKLGKERQIDPGHVVLNYGHSMGEFFPVAKAALKFLPYEVEAPELVRKKMLACLDWSQIPEESSEFLARMTRATINPAQ